ncbi:MAG: peptide-methionine (S)-S-oxide reductase MsrA [Pseudomonadota bacterium]
MSKPLHNLGSRFGFLGACAGIAVSVLFLLLSAPADAVNRVNLPNPVQLMDEKGTQTAVFAGGCFWGVEAVFRHTQGVLSATSGYAGGSAADANYDQVSTGTTGHAESVQVVYDPAKISYGQLLKIYFSVVHDPTQLNFQGPDHGTQYRSAIFTTNDRQAVFARAYISQLESVHAFGAPIVTVVTPLQAFYPAEDYHQNFLALHPKQPYIVRYDMPKLAQLQSQFPTLYR